MTLKTTPFDIVDFIQPPEDAIEYLKVVMEGGNSDEICAALSNIVRARGVQTIAKETCPNKVSLSKVAL